MAAHQYWSDYCSEDTIAHLSICVQYEDKYNSVKNKGTSDMNAHAPWSTWSPDRVALKWFYRKFRFQAVVNIKWNVQKKHCSNINKL